MVRRLKRTTSLSRRKSDGKDQSSLYVVTLSWLQTISRDLSDAAVIHAATRVAIFWRKTFPILAPTLSAVTVLLSVWTFKEFAAIWR